MAIPRVLARVRGESGQTLPLIVVFMLVLLAFCGLVIDLGNAYRVQQALQASTDAAASAGAGQLTLTYPPNTANAVSKAKYYGSSTGGINTISGLSASNVTENVATSCVLSNPNFPCNNANTVSVTQSASVPTYFLSVLGYNSIGISTSAKACSPCNETPLDIQLVIDRTGSMGQMGGSTNGQNKIANLKTGVLTGFLPGLDPGVDSVGLTLLPPDVNGTADVCNAASNANYDSTTPSYVVVNLENNYMANGNLVANDPLIKDINCLQAGGSTNYSNALEAAYAELQADGRTGVQKVIVLLSDGAANTGQNCTSTVHGRTVYSTDVHCTQPCHTAVNDANNYKAAGVMIFSILYGDQSGGPDCQQANGNNEVPAMTPQQAMNQIANANEYFPDPDPANLATIFQQISADMAAGSSRIVA